jgi:hypothetical protein
MDSTRLDFFPQDGAVRLASVTIRIAHLQIKDAFGYFRSEICVKTIHNTKLGQRG